jgi:hypothetical protein
MIAENWSWLSTAASVAGSIGTLIAVVTALWLQYFLVRYRRPRLELEYDPRLNESFTATYKPGHESIWLRLRVTNRHPAKETARSVQVLVTRAIRPAAAVERGPVPQRPIKWADIDAEYIDIPPGAFRYVDVGHLIRGKRPSDISKQRFRLILYPIGVMDDPEGTLEDQRHRLEPGEYIIELALTSHSTTARFFTLFVQFEAFWTEDPRNLHVKAALREGRISDPIERPALQGVILTSEPSA